MRCRRITICLILLMFMLLSLFGCVGKTGFRVPGQSEDNVAPLNSFLIDGANLIEGKEEPSLTLVLDRHKTAIAAMELVDVALNHMAISDTAQWPVQMKKYSKQECNFLDQDKLYASHNSQVPSAKKHVVSTQGLVYLLPPDDYALPDTYYENKELIMINSTLYTVGPHQKITKNTFPSGVVLEKGVDSTINHLYTKKATGKIKKKSGIIRGRQVRGSKGHIHANLMEAIYAVAPNRDCISKAYLAYNNEKAELKKLIEKIQQYSRDLVRVTNGKSPLNGLYYSQEDIEKQLNIEKQHFEACYDDLKKKQNIILAELENINKFQGTVVDEKELRVLKNVIVACEGIESLITDALFLEGAAIRQACELSGDSFKKYIKGVLGGLDELGKKIPLWWEKSNEEENQPKETVVMSPDWKRLADARVAAAGFDVITNPKTILKFTAKILYSDKKMINKVKEKASLLINKEKAEKIVFAQN